MTPCFPRPGAPSAPSPTAARVPAPVPKGPWHRDRGPQPFPLHRLRPLRPCLPDQRLRPGSGRRARDRPSGRLPDVLPVRGLLPGRGAVRLATADARTRRLDLQRRDGARAIRSARALPNPDRLGQPPRRTRPRGHRDGHRARWSPRSPLGSHRQLPLLTKPLPRSTPIHEVHTHISRPQRVPPHLVVARRSGVAHRDPRGCLRH